MAGNTEGRTRSLKIKRGQPSDSNSIQLTEATLHHAIRCELEKAGLPEIFAWRDEVNHNLQVIGVILSDLQSTATLAVTDEGTAKSRLDDLAFQMGNGMSTVV